MEADEPLQYTAGEFIRMLEADGGAELNPYNTIASFREGTCAMYSIETVRPLCSLTYAWMSS